MNTEYIVHLVFEDKSRNLEYHFDNKEKAFSTADDMVDSTDYDDLYVTLNGRIVWDAAEGVFEDTE